jgi:hypothetical protein
MERDPLEAVPELKCIACGRPNVVPVYTDEDRSGEQRKRANRQERRLKAVKP